MYSLAHDAMTDQHRSRDGFSGSGRLAQLVLERLGYGLLACDGRMVVLSITTPASRSLAAIGRPVVGHALPPRVESSLREAVRSERPVRVEASSGGQAAYLSAMEVEDLAPVAFVAWLRQEVMRESDLTSELRARYSLTARDAKLLFHLRSGHTNKQISSETGWTEGTVQVYVHHLYDKLDVHTRGAAVALVNGILHPKK